MKKESKKMINFTMEKNYTLTMVWAGTIMALDYTQEDQQIRQDHWNLSISVQNPMSTNPNQIVQSHDTGNY